MKTYANTGWEGHGGNRRQFITEYHHKEGVFKSPANDGTWIMRAKVGKMKKRTTISKHKTKEEAEKAYKDYYLYIP